MIAIYKSANHLLNDLPILVITLVVVDDFDGEGAARTLRDVFPLPDVFEGDLELIPTGAVVVEGCIFCIEI